MNNDDEYIKKVPKQVWDEIKNNLDSKEGNTVICKECNVSYIRGVWNFYNLCDTCFNQFDNKKMMERIGILFPNNTK